MRGAALPLFRIQAAGEPRAWSRRAGNQHRVLEGDTRLNFFAGCYRPWPKIPGSVHSGHQQKIRKVDRRAERPSGKIGKKVIIIYVGCSLPATLRTREGAIVF